MGAKPQHPRFVVSQPEAGGADSIENDVLLFRVVYVTRASGAPYALCVWLSTHVETGVVPELKRERHVGSSAATVRSVECWPNPILFRQLFLAIPARDDLPLRVILFI